MLSIIGDGFDYMVNTGRVRALANGQISNVPVSFRLDNIAQEPNETFTLTLDPLIQPNPKTGLFFQDAIQMTIMDSNGRLEYH